MKSWLLYTSWLLNTLWTINSFCCKKYIFSSTRIGFIKSFFLTVDTCFDSWHLIYVGTLEWFRNPLTLSKSLYYIIKDSNFHVSIIYLPALKSRKYFRLIVKQFTNYKSVFFKEMYTSTCRGLIKSLFWHLTYVMTVDMLD